ncbi:MazG nucleotide pyrophosphohydrolase domain-containing protein [Corynebacterium matruchotii]|uniref:MazG nucleotide pyrophosphohydrolase domain protein n=1 Tax=Corynebacterium matruchotii ATCC 33806 TaxID=566549 RepID=C0E7P7_9CORY|nr:MazG nucleotide pyrophosphohydrolase domain-containing protein [Corynebacterium matruchotii]EEG25422.1 MazG nucleotide pyrophosphohydrolase domain protein [Corynebacterium matruchotii ATCC 33806]
MTALTIIVLVDPRWPDQIPLGIIPYLYGVGSSRLEVTPDIPAAARDHYHQLAALPAPPLLQPVARLVITSDDADPRLTEPAKTAEKIVEETATRIFRVPSRDDPAWQAQNIMRRALTVGEWEREQTHETLLPYLREETTELAEAITTQADDAELMAELGDVLLQVLFHAEIAARRGAFDFGDVVGSFIGKMRRRSPYLFDGTTSVVPQSEQKRLWELGKHVEG